MAELSKKSQKQLDFNHFDVGILLQPFIDLVVKGLYVNPFALLKLLPVEY